MSSTKSLKKKKKTIYLLFILKSTNSISHHGAEPFEELKAWVAPTYYYHYWTYEALD